MIIRVPVKDAKPWPTLGPYVCAAIEENLVYGPGDLLGEPVKLDREKRGLIYSAYEVYPKTSARRGRRRYKRVAWSLRKGLAKTELAAMIAAIELWHLGPVRTVDWDSKGYPIGGPVTSPYIPLVAYTEEQTEDRAYGALKAILEESRIAKDFDIGLDRIMRIDGHGKAEPLASSPSAADGARTSFQHADETHHFHLPRLVKAWTTMLQNIPKRKIADAWSLETTTAFMPGQNSVAEKTMAYAQSIIDKKVSDPAFFFFHRQAGDQHDLKTEKGQRAAVIEASGEDGVAYGDIDEIVRQFKESSDKSYVERVWTNRLVRGSDKAFDVAQWAKLERLGYTVPDGSLIVLGFAGHRYSDSAAVVGTEVATGYQWVLGAWEQPALAVEGWEVPGEELDAVVSAAIARWQVWRLYANPFSWESLVADWAGRYCGDGDEKRRVVSVRSNQWVPLALMMRGYANAQTAGEVSHDGNAVLARHLGSAHRRPIQAKDDEGKPLWIIQKERADSPNPIDAARAGAYSWLGKCDAIGKGALNADSDDLIYNNAEARPEGFLSV